MTDSTVAAKGYVHPEVLVSTQWVADHLNGANMRVVESNEDILLYEQGHIPGAIQIDWVGDLNDKLRRDYLDRKAFSELMSRDGISNDTTVIFYGDKNNWCVCYGFWVFQLFGHENAKVMDGGRKKWIDENRPVTKDKPLDKKASYKAPERADYKFRAFRDQVRDHIAEGHPLVDVRSPKEYSGELLHMEAYPQEGALRGGHIPGAKSVPWGQAANEDGTFKSADELRAIYEQRATLSPHDTATAYCPIGERSTPPWLVR